MELASHPTLRAIHWTTLRIFHDTVDKPRVDTSIPGTNSIAFGLGAYVGGRFRIHGVPKPLQLHERAVEYDGSQIHSSGVFNGDRWFVILFAHEIWELTTPDQRRELSDIGFPCANLEPFGAAEPAAASPTAVGMFQDSAIFGASPTQVGLPAIVTVDGVLPAQAGIPGVLPAQAGVPNVLPAEAGALVDELSEETAEEDVIRGPKPPRTLAEALSQRHMMTHLPKNILRRLLKSKNAASAKTEEGANPRSARGCAAASQEFWRPGDWRPFY